MSGKHPEPSHSVDVTALLWHPHDIAEYVAVFSREFALVSKRAGMPFLGYILDMAALEAARELARSSTDAGRAEN